MMLTPVDFRSHQSQFSRSFQSQKGKAVLSNPIAFAARKRTSKTDDALTGEATSVVPNQTHTPGFVASETLSNTPDTLKTSPSAASVAFRDVSKLLTHAVRNHCSGVSAYIGLLEHGLEQLRKHLDQGCSGEVGNALTFLDDSLAGARLRLSHGLEDLTSLESLSEGIDPQVSLPLRRQPTSALIVLSRAEKYKDEAQTKGQTFVLDGALDGAKGICPAKLNVDLPKLTMALDNLVSNAVKYNDPGTEIRIYGEKIDNNLVITISDNGKGLPEKVKTKLFELKEKNRDYDDSTGMGLYLSAQFIKAHQGKLTLEPTEKGTTFKVTLPLLPEVPSA